MAIFNKNDYYLRFFLIRLLEITEMTSQNHGLHELAANTVSKIVSIDTENKELASRLLSLGLYPGASVEVLRAAPMGDPLQVRCGATLISIRLREAQYITVGAAQ